MQIENLQLQLRRAEDNNEVLERENRANEETIKGYKDSVVLAPH